MITAAITTTTNETCVFTTGSRFNTDTANAVVIKMSSANSAVMNSFICFCPLGCDVQIETEASICDFIISNQYVFVNPLEAKFTHS